MEGGMRAVERKVRIGGYQLSLRTSDHSVHLDIEADPNHTKARQEVFAMFDELRQNARRAGVSGREIMVHWVKNQLTRRNFVRK